MIRVEYDLADRFTADSGTTTLAATSSCRDFSTRRRVVAEHMYEMDARCRIALI
jgi:hypothetical protein